MSYHTWTAEELESNTVFLSGEAWRAVESQYIGSTLKLVDTHEEQDRLEELLDATKPPLPEGCDGLEYLLFTPFRYPPPNEGSRFRRGGQIEGAFYASEKIETALAEMAFYRLLFFAESPDTPLPENPGEYTLFKISYKSDRCIDLTETPLSTDQLIWTDPSSYTACQNLADECRRAKIDIIRSFSVRCNLDGKNTTLLSCKSFSNSKRIENQSWKLAIKKDAVIAIKSIGNHSLTFTKADFGDDPRLKS